jgi:MFS family permease
VTLGWAVLTAVGVAVLLSALGSHAPMVRLIGGAVGAILTFFGVLALTPAGTVLAKPGLPAVIATRGLLTFAFFGADAFVTLGLSQGRSTSVLFAGIVLSSASFTWTAGSWLQARLAGSWSHRRLVTTGLSCILLAIIGFGLIILTDIAAWVALPVWLLAGFGMGLAYAPLAQAVLILAPPERAGSTTAALQFSDVIGVAIGAGLGGVFVDLGVGNGMQLDVALVPVWGTCAAVAGIGLWASRRMPETGLDPVVSATAPTAKPYDKPV